MATQLQSASVIAKQDTTEISNYSFHLWTSKTPPIKYLTELLKDLLTEGNLECSSEGIKLLSIDVEQAFTDHDPDAYLKARDGIHFCGQWHRDVMEDFYKQYQIL